MSSSMIFFPLAPNVLEAMEGELDVRILEDLLHPLFLGGHGLDEFSLVTSEIPQFTDFFRWDEAPPYEPAPQELAEPFGVLHVSFSPRDILHVPRIDKHDLERILEMLNTGFQ